MNADPRIDANTRATLHGVTRVLASVNRAFLCLDCDLRIVHASPLLDQIAGEGAAARAVGLMAGDLLGGDLFGAGAPLRAALEDGERREGWRASIESEAGPRAVSITAAPLVADGAEGCDPLVRYVVILRPLEGETEGAAGPEFFAGAVAVSPAMQRIFRLVANLQQSDATVLITGESGTGKEVVARAIHQSSSRRHGPFVAVNCGALPAELLESELFGHVRGAFTGAVRDRAGRFETAAGGTLFLDEIGDLPLALQPKLLRVLQEHQYERVGESRPRSTDARIVAATHIDLRRALAEGRFREDLYYRLRVVPIEIPPLRARREDVAPLAQHLLARTASQQGRVCRWSPQALRVLLDCRWPGNVRQLSNAIEYAVAVSRNETIHAEDLPPDLFDEEPLADTLLPAGAAGEDEASRLRSALEAHRWHRDATAQALGISRATLWRKMRELHLNEPA